MSALVKYAPGVHNCHMIKCFLVVPLAPSAMTGEARLLVCTMSIMFGHSATSMATTTPQLTIAMAMITAIETLSPAERADLRDAKMG